MKKLLTSLGMVVALLLGGGLFTRTWAELTPVRPATVPAALYHISSYQGNFNDIRSNPATVALGTDLPAGTDLFNYFFEPTSATNMTPVSKKTTVTSIGTGTTGTTSYKNLTESEFCFPLGFNFKLSGKTMTHFLVSAEGGVYFSATGTRPPTTYNPVANAFTGDAIHANLYVSTNGTSMNKVNGAKKFKSPADGAPAYYLIEGDEGHRVLTTQHHIVMTDYDDDWFFQCKFYEETGNFELIVGELGTDGALSSLGSGKLYYYGMDFGLAEAYPTVGTQAYATNDTANATTNDARPWQLGIQTYASGGQHKWYASRYYGDADNGWNNPGPMTSAAGSKALQVRPGDKPESGRTILFTYPAYYETIPAWPESTYGHSETDADDGTYTVSLKYKDDVIRANFPPQNLTELGTILAVVSASDVPDFTLEKGTFYFKGHQFPESNGFVPTVLCNQMCGGTITFTGTPPAATPGLTNNPAITLKLTGLTKYTTRYIHIFRMMIDGDGRPVYSPLCFTIRREPKLGPPQLLETVGQPTVSSVKLHVQPADGLSVLIIKSPKSIKVPSLSGNLKEGSKLGNGVEVVKLLDAETTWEQPMAAGEGCYFIAVTVDKSGEKYMYSPSEVLWVPARAAYDGLPGLIEIKDEPWGNPNKELDGTNTKNAAWQAKEGNTYRDLPLGWTREMTMADGSKWQALGIGLPGYGANAPVGLYSAAPLNTSITTDAVTVPIKVDKSRIMVTFNMQFWAADGSGGVSAASPSNNESVQIQYATVGSNTWQSLVTYIGNSLPEMNTKLQTYPLSATFTDANLVGQYIRFRVIAKSRGGSEGGRFLSFPSIEIKEDKVCKTPTDLTQTTNQTTTTSFPFTWTDPNDSKAASYLIQYKRVGATGDWTEKTVTNTNATLTGLRSSTTYMVKMNAVCGEDGNSYPTDTNYFTTAYTFPYTEAMAQQDTVVKIQGSNATIPTYSPFTGKAMLSYIPFRDGGVNTYTGQLPNNGAATLSAPGAAYNAFSHSYTYNKNNNIKVTKPNGVQSVALKAVGVCERAQYAWLVTPVIYTVNLVESEPLAVRFKATSAARSGGAGNPWTKGRVGSKYNATTLKVLVSNSGSFANANVIATVNVGSAADINEKDFEFELPTPLTGSVQVAFYYANPNYIDDNATENNDDYMSFEIFDVRFEYKNAVALCPALEGLERTSLTPNSATFSWAPSDSAKYYELAYGPKSETDYAHTVQLTEAEYTINGLEAETEYKVMVTGYCDEEGENAAPDPLTAEFTTPEGCRIPINFTVSDITYYGAKFTSTQTQATLEKRELYVVSSDNAFKKTFTQTDNVFTTTDGLRDNKTYTVQTRSICRYGAVSADTSAWSDPVSFTTPADPTFVPDTFKIYLQVTPEGAGLVEGNGTYVEGSAITMKATENNGYIFKRWVDASGKTVSTEATFERMAEVGADEVIIDPDEKVHEYTYTAVFNKIYTINVEMSPSGNAVGTVNGGGLYEDGEQVMLIASEKSTYKFVAWVKPNAGDPTKYDTVSKSATYSFKPKESATYTALFIARPAFKLTAEVTPDENWGTVNFTPNPSEDETYLEGHNVTLTAVPAAYCRFVEWQDEDGNQVSTNVSLAVTMDGPKAYKAVFAQIRYTVTLVSNPNTTYGTINGTDGNTSTGGTFAGGSQRRVEAKPKSGYEFVKWMSGSLDLGTNPVLEFILTRDTTLTAYFQEKAQLDVTVTVEPASAGTVTGAGKINRGNNATLTATPAAHYAFKEWRRVDNSTISANPYTFKPDRDYTFTAVFRPLNNYTVTATTTGSGTVSGTGTHEEGANVTLTATPAEHYTFTEWQDADGNTLGTNSTYTITKLTGNTTVKAVFTEISKYTVTVTKLPENTAGSVTGAGEYYAGDKVTLTATPNSGYMFVEWTDEDGDNLSYSDSYEFNITGNVRCKAVFMALAKITVDTYPAGAGEVTGAKTYDPGEQVTLEATPDDEYVFVEWQDEEGNGLSNENPYEFEATESMNIKAVFREKLYFGIDVNIAGATDNDEDDLGSVSFSPIGDGGDWMEGTTVTMTATPDPYCLFVEWQDMNGNTLGTAPSYAFVIGQDTAFKAVFTHIRYKVTLKSDPSTAYGTITGTSGSTSTGGTFNGGTTRRLTAKPQPGYVFTKWMSGTKDLGTNPVLEFVLTQDTTITAYFAQASEYNITLNVRPAGAGTVSGQGKVTRGDEAELVAVANGNYKFDYWESSDGTKRSEDNPYKFTPTRDHTFTAVFRTKNEYDINVVRVPNNNAGTVQRAGFLSNGKALEDATVTLTAVPATGYTFKEWQNQTGKQVSTEATLSITATANATYQAVFEEIPTVEYTVTVIAQPANGGRIFNDGTYEEGTEVKLKARPYAAFTFDGWYDATGTTKLETDTVFTVTLTADVTYMAKFAEKTTVDVLVDVLPTAEAGSVTGAGSYAKGQSVTLTATAAEGYTFYRWVDVDNDNAPIDNVNPYTFAPTANVHYAAVFRGQFEVAVNILPDDNAGDVTGTGFYRQGAKATLEATANPGYWFVEWQDENGNMLSENRSMDITVNGNVTYNAKFVTIDQEHRHTITVKRLPDNEAGTVKGAGRYLHGDKDTLSATPAANYLFVAWLKPKADNPDQYDTVSKKNPYIFTVAGDSTYAALFRPRARYQIDVDILPNDMAGTVTGDGQYREGQQVTLIASPNEGYVFVAWVNPAKSAPNDTITKSATYTFTASENATYKAVFRRTAANYTLTLNVTPANGGTVTGEGVYRANQTVTLTAKPNAGYVFVGWRLNNNIVSTDPSYQFQITRDMTFTAVFRQKDVLNVTLNVTPENAGTVTGAGDYVRYAEATVTATPNRGYRFVEWQNEDGETLSTDATYSFEVLTDVTYTAVFEESDLETYVVKLDVLPSGSAAGTVTGAGSYVEGTMVTITATANNGYKFVKWQDAVGNTLSEEPVYTFEITSDMTFWALFEETKTDVETVIIALKALPNDAAGTLKGAGMYEKGAQAIITATPAANYTFVAWLDANGDTVSKTATYSFKAEKDATYSALFKAKGTPNEQQLRASFNVGAGNGHLFIDNLNAVVVREVVVYNTTGRQLAHFTPNSNANLALPVDARYAVLVVRVVSEQGVATYKVYLH